MSTSEYINDLLGKRAAELVEQRRRAHDPGSVETASILTEAADEIGRQIGREQGAFPPMRPPLPPVPTREWELVEDIEPGLEDFDRLTAELEQQRIEDRAKTQRPARPPMSYPFELLSDIRTMLSANLGEAKFQMTNILHTAYGYTIDVAYKGQRYTLEIKALHEWSVD